MLGVGCVLLGSVAAALAIASSSAAPLVAWIDARATAVVSGEVAGEPLVRVLGSAPVWQSSSRVEVRLDAHRVSARGESVDLAVPIILTAGSRGGRAPAGDGDRGDRSAARDPAATRRRRGARLSREGRRRHHRPGDSRRGGPDRARHAHGPAARPWTERRPPRGSLVAGLSVGDDSWQPPDLAVAMRDSGLSHLTAVSGGNVAIVLGLVFALVTVLRLPLAARIDRRAGLPRLLRRPRRAAAERAAGGRDGRHRRRRRAGRRPPRRAVDPRGGRAAARRRGAVAGRVLGVRPVRLRHRGAHPAGAEARGGGSRRAR